MEIHKFKIFFSIFAIAILAMLLLFLICLKLAFTDDNTDKYNSSPDYTPAQNIAVNAVLGNQTDISEEELNSLIAYFIQQADNNGSFNRNCNLLAAYIDINSEEPNRCYFQVEYKKRKLGFSADLNIEFDYNNNQLSLSFTNAKIGRLKIPDKLIIFVLEKTNIADSSEHISITHLEINIPTHISIEIPGIGDTVQVDIKNFQINKDQIHIETNPILNDSLNNLKEALGDKIFDFAKENLSDILGGYLEKFKQN